MRQLYITGMLHCLQCLTASLQIQINLLEVETASRHSKKRRKRIWACSTCINVSMLALKPYAVNKVNIWPIQHTFSHCHHESAFWHQRLSLAWLKALSSADKPIHCVIFEITLTPSLGLIPSGFLFPPTDCPSFRDTECFCSLRTVGPAGTN